jgi:hypothetical protein
MLFSFPSDLQALHRIPVHSIIAKEDHKFLSDYVPEDKLLTWAESCKAAHGNYEVIFFLKFLN